MRKIILPLAVFCLMATSCAHEFNQVYKSSDYAYKYEYAKECFANGKYTRATTLLQELIVQLKGHSTEQESLYLLAMSELNNKDYQTAAEAFRKYIKSYPRGIYAEMATYNLGLSLFLSTPEPRLDQTETVNAIAALQDYLDIYPDGKMRQQAQKHLIELQDKLVTKELYSARLYYHLGTYFGNCSSGGNNYEACIVTAQNALKDYPYNHNREDFALLIMRSKYELAQQSVEARRLERLQDAEDECYGFINEYPDSKQRGEAEQYIEKLKKQLKNLPDNDANQETVAQQMPGENK